MVFKINNLNKSAVSFLFLLILVVYFISFFEAVPNEDEAVIASHSYFFNKLGYVKSDLYGGYGYNWEIRQYHFHKLFVLAGSFMSSVFGFNVYTFKSVSLIFTLFFFLFLYLYTKDFMQKYNKHSFFLISATILLLNNIFFKHSFMYRPELAVMCLGFISYYYLKKGMVSGKNIFFILAGTFAGLSAFTHLNGLIFCSAGGIFLLIKKKFKPVFFFGLFAGIFTLLYFYDIRTIDELKILNSQISNDPNVLYKENAFISLIKEYMRLFWSPKEIIFSTVFFTALISDFKYFKKYQPDVLTYLLLLFISLGMLAHGKTTKYSLYYFPFMVLIITEFIFNIKSKTRTLRISFYSILAIYCIIHMYFNFTVINSHINIAGRSQEIASLIPERNVKVSAPSVFAFNQINNFTIRGPIAFDHHYLAFKPGEEQTLCKYFKFAEEHGDKYIIIDKKLNKRKFILNSDIDTIRVNDVFCNYELISRQDSIYIFRN